jgi:hypothetical protein
MGRGHKIGHSFWKARPQANPMGCASQAGWSPHSLRPLGSRSHSSCKRLRAPRVYALSQNPGGLGERVCGGRAWAARAIFFGQQRPPRERVRFALIVSPGTQRCARLHGCHLLPFWHPPGVSRPTAPVRAIATRREGRRPLRFVDRRGSRREPYRNHPPLTVPSFRSSIEVTP